MGGILRPPHSAGRRARFVGEVEGKPREFFIIGMGGAVNQKGMVGFENNCWERVADAGVMIYDEAPDPLGGGEAV